MTTAETDRSETTETAIADLRRGAKRLVALGVAERQQLLRDCVAGVADHWQQWVEDAWAAKRIGIDSAARAEDILSGPLSTLRYLWLLHQTLDDIADQGRPRLPRDAHQLRGHLRVPVFPTRSLYDRLLFGPIQASVRMSAGIDVDTVFGHGVERASGRGDDQPAVVLVLGAGNVSSIPITDALTKIFQDNQAVLLKMNPVNEYAGRVFESAFASLVDADVLRVVYGAADVGAKLISSGEVDCVHITGSDRTHDAIVWGSDPQQQMERKAAGNPLLRMPITSELGNVSPWIVVPGRYSERQLRFQAENIVASVTSNASFACIATKMVITCKDWPQRDSFLNMIDEILVRTPRRFAYYPGAADRFVRFAGTAAESVDDCDYLPWTFRHGVDVDTEPYLFQEESFVCVFGETDLAADSSSRFLEAAIEFANQRMWGTLAASVTVPQNFERQTGSDLGQAIDRLKYGTVGINQWPGVAFTLMSTPWGAYPGATLSDIQSGIGNVHNTFLLGSPEQTVLSSKLTILPKPMWFSNHRCPELVAQSLLKLYMQPSFWRVPSVAINAIRG